MAFFHEKNSNFLIGYVQISDFPTANYIIFVSNIRNGSIICSYKLRGTVGYGNGYYFKNGSFTSSLGFVQREVCNFHLFLTLLIDLFSFSLQKIIFVFLHTK